MNILTSLGIAIDVVHRKGKLTVIRNTPANSNVNAFFCWELHKKNQTVLSEPF